MRRQTTMAAAVFAAMFVSSAAFAQGTPPASDNPNDAVPDAMPFNIPYGEAINIASAKNVAAAAVAEATKRNWKMCVAVVDPSGNLVYFERMDDCQYASISIAQHKARVAAKFRRPTLLFEQGMARGPNFAYIATLDDVIASRGGNPLVLNGKLIGAIGVSGGTGSQDDATSKAGVAALK